MIGNQYGRDERSANPDATTWDEVSRGPGRMLLGRNALPAALYEAFKFGQLGKREHLDELARGVNNAWTSAEFPGLFLDRDTWLEMLSTTGFLYGEQRAPEKRPTTRVRVWRGAPAAHRRGLAWTVDRERAEWFRDRNLDFGLDAKLWTLLAPPASILADFRDDEGGRHEGEYLVDTYTLDPEEVA